MKVLLEKTDNDDKLIKALREELRGKGPRATVMGATAGGGSKSDAEYSAILVENVTLREEKNKIRERLKAAEKALEGVATGGGGGYDEEAA